MIQSSLSLRHKAAGCLAFMLLVTAPMLIRAQSTDPPSQSNITASPTDIATFLMSTGTPTAAPTTSAPIPVSLSPTSVATILTLVPESASPTTSAPIETLVPATESPTLSPVTDSPTITSTLALTNPPTTSSPVPLMTEWPSRISTSAPTISLTSLAPTSSPIVMTPAPTDSPSLVPSLEITSATPSQSPTTSFPSAAPSAPTTKSFSPSSFTTTQSPSQSETQSPTRIIKPIIVSGLKITLTGISSIDDTSSWASTTSSFFKSQYEESGQMSSISVEVIYTSQKAISTTKRWIVRGRRLQSQSDAVEIEYRQFTTYSTSNSSLTLDDVLQLPLMDITQQAGYIEALKEFDEYENLIAVSAISLPSSGEDDDDFIDPDTDDSFPLWAIITIAVGGGVLLICTCLFVYRKFFGSNRKQLDLSPQDSSRPHITDPGEQTVGTVDYDYSKAYNNSGNFSLSDAGGTYGSRTRQTTDLMHPAGNATIFSEDPTYNETAFQRSGLQEMFDIYAPAGKLGVVIDTPDDGAPVVHAVKDTSPIVDKIRVGDKLVAVDDEDVRAFTAIQVSRLISKKSVNASRKMTVIRNI